MKKIAEKDKEKNFWKNYLKGLDTQTDLPIKGKEHNPVVTQGETYGFVLDKKIGNQLEFFLKESRLNLSAFFYCAWGILLRKYYNSDDVVFGTAVPGRSVTVSNLLPLRITIQSHEKCIDMLRQVNRELKVREDYESPTLIDIKEYIGFSADEEVFDTIVVIENNPLSFNSDSVAEMTHYDLTVSVTTGNEIACNFYYSKDVFAKETIFRLSHHFIAVMKNIIDEPLKSVSEIDMLSDKEKRQILFEFNGTYVDYLRDKTIPQLFEEQTARTPDPAAVVGMMHRAEESHSACPMPHTVTYMELNQRSNQLACVLRKKGVQSDTVVSLMMERTVDMMVGMLGILKAGGAYMPIDPASPKDRVLTILNDANTTILLTDKESLDNHSFTALQHRWPHFPGKEPLLSPPRPRITDLDQLPFPDRSLVNYETYNHYIGLTIVKNSISLQATRGCPYNCAYCSKIWPKTHIVRSAENLAAEVRRYYNMGMRRFDFVDDIFNLDIENSQRFFQIIIKEGLNVQFIFSAGLRGDLLTQEYIDLMVQAGTIHISLALETASPRLQKLIGKNLNLEKLRKNLEYITAKYPHVILELFTMLGFPTETEEEALMTMDFIKRIKWLHFPYVHILKIYPNTRMEKLALESGIRAQAIAASRELAWHELPETLPFSKTFTQKYQAEFLNSYFLNKERLLNVLPHQMKLLTEDEIVQKYNSYLPIHVGNLTEFLRYAGITFNELGTAACLEETDIYIPHLNEKMKEAFPTPPPNKDAFRVLLLDLSQYFSTSQKAHYDPVEPPLGLMYIMTWLKQQLSTRVDGRIAKSRIDFDNYEELHTLLHEFKPNVIGIRALTYYREFLHKTISVIRQWGIQIPVITGGPYATSDYKTLLQDPNVDLAVLGEGEITFTELVTRMIRNNGQLPDHTVLKTIKGLAFIPRNKEKHTTPPSRNIMIFNTLNHLLEQEPHEDLTVSPTPTNLAYVLFTSGSTGVPKGALVEHGNVINLVTGYSRRIFRDYTGGRRAALVAPYVFDASVKQIFTSLLMGHTLVIVPEDIRIDIMKLTQFYIKYQIDCSDGTPTHIRLLLENPRSEIANLPVNHFLIGGEALPPHITANFLDCFETNKPRITNVYGPTECCVEATSYDVTLENIKTRHRIPIGKPLANQHVYIIDRDFHLQAVGLMGELCIAGNNVGRGYINQPELTVEKFVFFSYRSYRSYRTYISKKIYKTGDLARWLPDGNIEFLGRKDFQVKIRGFRIELGEIEKQLLKHEQIKEAVVIDRVLPDGDKHLCAYIVANNAEPSGTPGDISEIPDLREYLSQTLPCYMIPSFFVYLDKIPINPNDKIDRKALPLPGIKAGNDYAPPRNNEEKKLVNMWSEILGIEKDTIGINTNFFEIGGHSVTATMVLRKIKEEFNVFIPLAEIFRSSTIIKLSEHIQEAK